jgi:tRNA (cytidine/uridine-2'-O-)-methyltransferase
MDLSRSEIMVTVVLVNPEIPPNTGNIGRLTLGTRTELMIVGEPSFELDSDTAVKRAGLDYWEDVDPDHFTSWEEYLDHTTASQRFLVTKFTDKPYTDVEYDEETHLIFGGETRGVPDTIHQSGAVTPVSIPMNDHIRAYNLANSTAIVLFEAIRQIKPDWTHDAPYGEAEPPSFS